MNEKTPLPKCLLVDDLKENLIALTSLLADEEMEVLTAQSGKDALELLLVHDFALALLDVQMPEMDGFELAEIMRSTEKTRAIPIIFVTAAGADTNKIFQGYEAGAVDFLHKPLNTHIVLSKIRVFLKLYQQKVQLEQKQQNLQKALQSRDDFMSICSHELKTPLTSLKMQLQMTHRLKEKFGEARAYEPDQMKKFMEQADRSIERIIHLVNDMLDISRVTTGRLSLTIEDIDLADLARDVAARLQPLMDMASNTVSFDMETDVHVKADRFRVEQVITNLLMNAAKYAPESPIEISLRKKHGQAELVVKDFGRGISPDDQKRIFERFERAVSASTASGLGLGLYISKEIMHMHGGDVSVQSELGRGSSFKIQLPTQ